MTGEMPQFWDMVEMEDPYPRLNRPGPYLGRVIGRCACAFGRTAHFLVQLTTGERRMLVLPYSVFKVL